MKTSIEKLLRALPCGSFYDIEPSDVGARRFCEFDNPAPTCEGPAQEHDIGRRCMIIDGELREESGREYKARQQAETAARESWHARQFPAHPV